MRRTKRNLPITLVCLIIVLVVCARVYYECVPRGASFVPFVGYSRELPTITSPNGKLYRVFVNDAGAMHSGNHWTWVVDRHWLTGRYVVTEGYVTSEYATGDADLVVKWNGDQPVIQFETGRY